MARTHDFDVMTEECRGCHAPKRAVENRWVPSECIGVLSGKSGFIVIDEYAFGGGSTLADSDGDDGA